MSTTVKIHGKNRAGKEVALTKSQPQQMTLFQTFLSGQQDKYSNTIELYDAIPKYISARRVRYRCI